MLGSAGNRLATTTPRTAVSTTKERIVNAGAELFGRQGYTGTGVKQVVAAADAPIGSLYHHFPGGTAQLGEQVIRLAGPFYATLVEVVIDPAPDVVAGVELFFSAAAEHLAASGYADACPIATITLGTASVSEPMRQASHDVFESWLAALARRLADAGIAPDAARELAIVMLTLLEGAFLLCRAARSTEALEVAGRHATALVRAALP